MIKEVPPPAEAGAGVQIEAQVPEEAPVTEAQGAAQGGIPQAVIPAAATEADPPTVPEDRQEGPMRPITPEGTAPIGEKRVQIIKK